MEWKSTIILPKKHKGIQRKRKQRRDAFKTKKKKKEKKPLN